MVLVSAYGATLDTWGHVVHIFTIIDIVGIALRAIVAAATGAAATTARPRGGRRAWGRRWLRAPPLAVGGSGCAAAPVAGAAADERAGRPCASERRGGS